MKKYRLLENDIIRTASGRVLCRIQCITSFGTIKEGSLGGYIECEDNLSHKAGAWVHRAAQVYGDARVYGDAQVYGNARVYEEAHVFGYALVHGNARVHGNGFIYGNAQVFDNARVFGDAQVFGRARVYGKTRLYGAVLIYDNAKVSNYAYVYGEARLADDVAISSNTDYVHFNHKYNVTIYKNKVRIGCKEYTSWDDLKNALRSEYKNPNHSYSHKELASLWKLLKGSKHIFMGEG